MKLIPIDDPNEKRVVPVTLNVLSYHLKRSPDVLQLGTINLCKHYCHIRGRIITSQQSSNSIEILYTCGTHAPSPMSIPLSSKIDQVDLDNVRNDMHIGATIDIYFTVSIPSTKTDTLLFCYHSHRLVQSADSSPDFTSPIMAGLFNEHHLACERFYEQNCHDSKTPYIQYHNPFYIIPMELSRGELLSTIDDTHKTMTFHASDFNLLNRLIKASCFVTHVTPSKDSSFYTIECSEPDAILSIPVNVKDTTYFPYNGSLKLPALETIITTIQTNKFDNGKHVCSAVSLTYEMPLNPVAFVRDFNQAAAICENDIKLLYLKRPDIQTKIVPMTMNVLKNNSISMDLEKGTIPGVVLGTKPIRTKFVVLRVLSLAVRDHPTKAGVEVSVSDGTESMTLGNHMPYHPPPADIKPGCVLELFFTVICTSLNLIDLQCGDDSPVSLKFYAYDVLIRAHKGIKKPQYHLDYRVIMELHYARCRSFYKTHLEEKGEDDTNNPFHIFQLSFEKLTTEIHVGPDGQTPILYDCVKIPNYSLVNVIARVVSCEKCPENRRKDCFHATLVDASQTPFTCYIETDSKNWLRVPPPIGSTVSFFLQIKSIGFLQKSITFEPISFAVIDDYTNHLRISEHLQAVSLEKSQIWKNIATSYNSTPQSFITLNVYLYHLKTCFYKTYLDDDFNHYNPSHMPQSVTTPMLGNTRLKDPCLVAWVHDIAPLCSRKVLLFLNDGTTPQNVPILHDGCDPSKIPQIGDLVQLQTVWDQLSDSQPTSSWRALSEPKSDPKKKFSPQLVSRKMPRVIVSKTKYTPHCPHRISAIGTYTQATFAHCFDQFKESWPNDLDNPFIPISTTPEMLMEAVYVPVTDEVYLHDLNVTNRVFSTVWEIVSVGRHKDEKFYHLVLCSEAGTTIEYELAKSTPFNSVLPIMTAIKQYAHTNLVLCADRDTGDIYIEFTSFVIDKASSNSVVAKKTQKSLKDRKAALIKKKIFDWERKKILADNNNNNNDNSNNYDDKDDTYVKMAPTISPEFMMYIDQRLNDPNQNCSII